MTKATSKSEKHNRETAVQASFKPVLPLRTNYSLLSIRKPANSSPDQPKTELEEPAGTRGSQSNREIIIKNRRPRERLKICRPAALRYQTGLNNAKSRSPDHEIIRSEKSNQIKSKPRELNPDIPIMILGIID